MSTVEIIVYIVMGILELAGIILIACSIAPSKKETRSKMRIIGVALMVLGLSAFLYYRMVRLNIHIMSY